MRGATYLLSLVSRYATFSGVSGLIVCTPPPQTDQAERSEAGQPGMPGRRAAGSGRRRQEARRQGGRETLQSLTVATDRQTEDPISIPTQRQHSSEPQQDRGRHIEQEVAARGFACAVPSVPCRTRLKDTGLRHRWRCVVPVLLTE